MKVWSKTTLIFLISLNSMALPLGKNWPKHYLGINEDGDQIRNCAETNDSIHLEVLNIVSNLDISSCDVIYSNDADFCRCFRENTGSVRLTKLLETVHKEGPRLDALYRQMLYGKLNEGSKDQIKSLMTDMAIADARANNAGHGDKACFRNFLSEAAKNQDFYYSRTLIASFYGKFRESPMLQAKKNEVLANENMSKGQINDYCEAPVKKMMAMMELANSGNYSIKDVFSIDAKNRENAIGGLHKMQQFLPEEMNAKSMLNTYYCLNYEKANNEELIANNERRLQNGKQREAFAHAVKRYYEYVEQKAHIEAEVKMTEAEMSKFANIVITANAQIDEIEKRIATENLSDEQKDALQTQITSLKKEAQEATLSRKEKADRLVALRKDLATADVRLSSSQKAKDSFKASKEYESRILAEINAGVSGEALSANNVIIVESGGRVATGNDFFADKESILDARLEAYSSGGSLNKGAVDEVVADNSVFAQEAALMNTSGNQNIASNQNLFASAMPVANDFVNNKKSLANNGIGDDSAADIIREGVGKINEAAIAQKKKLQDEEQLKDESQRQAQSDANFKKALDMFNESNSKISALEKKLADLEKEKNELEKKSKAPATSSAAVSSSNSQFKFPNSSKNDRTVSSSKSAEANSRAVASAGDSRLSQAGINNVSAPSSASGSTSASISAAKSSGASASSVGSSAFSLTEVKNVDVKALPKSLVMAVDKAFMSLSPSEQQAYLDELVAGNEFIYVKFPDGKVVKVEGKGDEKKASQNSRSIATIDKEKANILRQIDRARQRHSDLKALMKDVKVENK